VISFLGFGIYPQQAAVRPHWFLGNLQWLRDILISKDSGYFLQPTCNLPSIPSSETFAPRYRNIESLRKFPRRSCLFEARNPCLKVCPRFLRWDPEDFGQIGPIFSLNAITGSVLPKLRYGKKRFWTHFFLNIYEYDTGSMHMSKEVKKSHWR
jgi:hypothetical protein